MSVKPGVIMVCAPGPMSRQCVNLFVPFEKAVKEGGSTAVMSSYNNIGTTWAGASTALLTNVLRNEWGFIGTVITDNNEEHGFMDIEKLSWQVVPVCCLAGALRPSIT